MSVRFWKIMDWLVFITVLPSLIIIVPAAILAFVGCVLMDWVDAKRIKAENKLL